MAVVAVHATGRIMGSPRKVGSTFLYAGRAPSTSHRIWLRLAIGRQAKYLVPQGPIGRGFDDFLPCRAPYPDGEYCTRPDRHDGPCARVSSITGEQATGG